MIIRTTLLIALIEYSFLNVSGCIGYNCTPATTELEKFHSQVLKRRTRSVLFPKGASLLLTPTFAKAIIDGRPRGLLYSMEFDMYNSLPDTVEGWQPTILVNKIKQQQDIEKRQTAAIIKVAAVQTNTTDKSILNKYTYSDVLADAANNWPFDGLNDQGDYRYPLYETETPNNWNYYESQWDNDPTHFARNFENPHIKKSFKLNSIAKQFHKKPYLDRRYRKNFNTHNNINYDKKRPPYRSHDDQRYRERRHIFDQLETVGKLFHFNMKACIQRAICEITTHLQPYGETLMEDLIRLILTIPSPPQNHSDDYDHSYESINCEQHFSVSCPYRVLDILFHNLRSNMDQWSK